LRALKRQVFAVGEGKSQFRAEMPVPMPCPQGQGIKPPQSVSHSRSRSSAVRWEGEGKYPEGERAKTPQEHSGQPQPSLPFSKAGKPGSAPNCTKSHPRYTPPSADGDDSPWSKNTSPTSRSIFIESH